VGRGERRWPKQTKGRIKKEGEAQLKRKGLTVEERREEWRRKIKGEAQPHRKGPNEEEQKRKREKPNQRQRTEASLDNLNQTSPTGQ